MFGKLFKQAASQIASHAAGAISEATGVEAPAGLRGSAGSRDSGGVEFTGPFGHSVLVDGERAPFLRAPRPDPRLSAEALQYAERWYRIWDGAFQPHGPAVAAVRAGDAEAARRQLSAWRQAMAVAEQQQAALGDFQGGRSLLLAASVLSEQLDEMHAAVRAHLAARLGGDAEGAQDAALQATGVIADFLTERNGRLAEFFRDPSGAAARQAEDEAFAAAEAVRRVDEGAPELQPVDGIGLHDYVAASARLQAGAPAAQIAAALGVERPQLDRALHEWTERLRSHPMTVGVQYANLMNRPHPRLDATTPGGTADERGGPSPAQRLRTDRDFYIEAAAAMSAAGEAGIDGGGYLQEHYGVTIAEVAAAGTVWMSDMRNASALITLQQAKQAEIAARIAGPGAADDIEF